MSRKEGYVLKARQKVPRPFSSRTLHRPSFTPVYMAAWCRQKYTDARCHPAVRSKGYFHCLGRVAATRFGLLPQLPFKQRGLAPPHADVSAHPIVPPEFFYTDPSMPPGSRIPNLVTDLRVLDCLRLCTPPPIMSATVAPPTHPDPFRSRFHPTRDLGSSTCHGLDPKQLPGKRQQVIVQLSQAEDQAITTLLKLHHDKPQPGPADSQKKDNPSSMDSGQEGRSDVDSQIWISQVDQATMSLPIQHHKEPQRDPPDSEEKVKFIDSDNGSDNQFEWEDESETEPYYPAKINRCVDVQDLALYSLSLPAGTVPRKLLLQQGMLSELEIDAVIALVMLRGSERLQ